MTSLIEAWKHAKEQENFWNKQRIDIESQIYERERGNLPDKGTYTTEEGMKIAIGHTEEWNQEQLNAAYQEWEAPVPFPFTGTWKPDSKAISYLRDNMPAAYAKLREALTLKPKKPSFTLKDAA